MSPPGPRLRGTLEATAELQKVTLIHLTILMTWQFTLARAPEAVEDTEGNA